jgi:hypothetical protein
MRLSDEQLATLQTWQANYDTVLRAKWAMNPGTAALETMVGIWNAVTGQSRRLNPGCSNCIYNLLKDVGQLYYAEVQARIDAQNDRKAVELSEAQAKPVKKVTVKTKAKKK